MPLLVLEDHSGGLRRALSREEGSALSDLSSGEVLATGKGAGGSSGDGGLGGAVDVVEATMAAAQLAKTKTSVETLKLQIAMARGF